MIFPIRLLRDPWLLSAILMVFTAGIGENSPEIRRLVCARTAWLGLTLDETANRSAEGRISTADSRVAAWVIPTDEEIIIARRTIAVTA